MAKKPSLTPRERKTMSYVNKAGLKYGEVSLEFNEVMDSASVVQDLLYFRALSSEVSNTDIKRAYREYKTAVKELDEMFASAMGVQEERELYAEVVLNIRER